MITCTMITCTMIHMHNDHMHNVDMNNADMNNDHMNNDHIHDEHVHDYQPGHHAHHHSSMHDIENIIQGLDVNDNVKKNAVEVYKLIAEAESNVHGKTVDEIHFHEVGSLDAVADVVAVCYLIDGLNPDNIICIAGAHGIWACALCAWNPFRCRRRRQHLFYRKCLYMREN